MVAAVVSLCVLLVVGVAQAEEMLRVGFGSCNKHDKDQSFWHTVSSSLSRSGAVDGFVWLGDVVYADRSPFPGVWVPEPLHTMQNKLLTFRKSPLYDNFVSLVRTPEQGGGGVMGVWDDHDMGKNDGGKEYEHRAPMQQYFLDFLDVPSSSPRRTRQGLFSLQGVKAINALDTAPFTFALCVLLLDSRFNRDPIGSNGDMLGAEQWKWLESVLKNPSSEGGGFVHAPLSSQCAFTAIGSGVQVLGDEKPTEHWGHFSQSRFRLLTLLKESQMERFFFISGDVHYAEIQVEDPSPFGFPLVDVTSSGMTHSVGPVLPDWLFDFTCHTPRRRGRYLRKNFGVIRIDREAKSGELQLTISANDISGAAPVLNFSTTASAMKLTHQSPWRDIDIHSGRLKTVVWSVHQALFPSMPVHKLLTGFIVIAALCLLVVGLGSFKLVRICVKRLSSKSGDTARSKQNAKPD